MIVTDPNGNDAKTTFTCVLDGFNPWYTGDSQALADLTADPPCYEATTTYYQGSSSGGTLLKTVATTYDGASGSAHPGAIVPISVTTTWAAGNLVSKVTTNYDWMNVGPGNITWKNPTQKFEYDWGTGSPGALLRETDISYLHQSNASYRNAGIADRPVSKIIKNGSGTVLAQAQYCYDGSTSGCSGTIPSYTYMVGDLGSASNHDSAYGTGNTLRGNLTVVSHWVSGSTWTVSQNQYDDLGNLRQSKDANGNLTTYSYSDSWYSNHSCVATNVNTQAFVTQVTNALSQISKSAFYPCTGLIGQSQDPNDLAAGRAGTTYVHDGMNRPWHINYPDGGVTNFFYGTSAPFIDYEEHVIDANNSVFTWTQRDGLGRQNRTAPSNGESNSAIVTDQTDTCFDNMGRKSFVRYPYQGPGWGNNSYTCANTNTNNPTATSGPGDQFTYYNDALGRPYQTINSDGSSTTTSYPQGNQVKVCDQVGSCRLSQYDGLGNLAKVWEDPAGANYETVVHPSRTGQLV